MWVYFNASGTLTCQVPNGEIIRQGGSFVLYAALPFDYDVQGMSGSLSFYLPNGDSINGTPIKSTDDSPYLKRFVPFSVNAATFDLLSGQDYEVFEFEVPDSLYVTQNSGAKTAVIEILDSSGNQVMLGRITLYVEPTYGTKAQVNITLGQYNQMLSLVNGKVSLDLSAYHTVTRADLSLSSSYMYVQDSSGGYNKIAVSQVGGANIKTVDAVPSDMATDDYIFLKKQ